MIYREFTTLPTGKPVTLQQAKDFLRIDFDVDDLIIESMISTATTFVEQYTGRDLQTKQARVHYPFGITDPSIDLVSSPLQSVQGVFCDGEEIDSSLYKVIKGPQRSYLIPVTSWPRNESAYVDITIGYGDTTPPAFISAILMTVANLYENRGDALPDRGVALTPQVQLLLSAYKVIGV